MHHSSHPSTLQSPSVLPNSNSLQHALSLPPNNVQSTQSNPAQSLPQLQQQQQFIQPHAIHHQPQPSQVPVHNNSSIFSNSPHLNPPLEPQSSVLKSAESSSNIGGGSNSRPGNLDTEGPPAKRPRGRPKGSKTKNRRVDGVLQPIVPPISIPNTTATNGPSTAVEDDEERDEIVDMDDISVPPSSSHNQLQQAPSNNSFSSGGDRPASATQQTENVDMDASSPSQDEVPAIISQPVISFYDFQWRALNLCSQFYEAAGELVRLTPPDILAQSFQLGSRADPLVLLNNAKEICEVMLASPGNLSQGQMPPPIPATMFPTSGNLSQHVVQNNSFVSPTNIADHSVYSYLPPTIPPQSLASGQPTLSQSHPAIQVSHPPPTTPTGQHGWPQPFRSHPPSQQATPSYSTVNPPSYGYTGNVPTNPPVNPSSSPIAPGSSQPQFNLDNPTSTKTITAGPSVHGPWKEWEMERLKYLAEQSKERTGNGEIDWDWTVDQFGDTRTRHQILIKATALNLKPSSTHPSRQKKRLSTSHPSSDQGGIMSGQSLLAQTLPRQGMESGGSSESLENAGYHYRPNRERIGDMETMNPPLTGISPSTSIASTPSMHHDRPNGDSMSSELHTHPHQTSASLHNRRSSSGASILASPAIGPGSLSVGVVNSSMGNMGQPRQPTMQQQQQQHHHQQQQQQQQQQQPQQPQSSNSNPLHPHLSPQHSLQHALPPTQSHMVQRTHSQHSTGQPSHRSHTQQHSQPGQLTPSGSHNTQIHHLQQHNPSQSSPVMHSFQYTPTPDSSRNRMGSTSAHPSHPQNQGLSSSVDLTVPHRQSHGDGSQLHQLHSPHESTPHLSVPRQSGVSQPQGYPQPTSGGRYISNDQNRRSSWGHFNAVSGPSGEQQPISSPHQATPSRAGPSPQGAGQGSGFYR